jgi:hypothetical protein
MKNQNGASKTTHPGSRGNLGVLYCLHPLDHDNNNARSSPAKEVASIKAGAETTKVENDHVMKKTNRKITQKQKDDS